MNERINDGGPAFPSYDIHGDGPAGMSLRDWFAGQNAAALAARFFGDISLAAAHGEVAEEAVTKEIGTVMTSVVGVAFALADAMLAARNQPTTKGEQQ